MEKDKEIKTGNSEKKITRKQAIQKAGITALTTASLVFLQTQARAHDSAGSPANPQSRGRGVSQPANESETGTSTTTSSDNDKSNNGNHYGQDKNR